MLVAIVLINMKTNQHKGEIKMKKKATKIHLECMECGKKFKRSGTKLEYQCPKCHGYDIDLDCS